MQGIAPHRIMPGVAGRLDGLRERAEIEGLLDELAYLMELLERDLQTPTRHLAERLPCKLDKAP